MKHTRCVGVVIAALSTGMPNTVLATGGDLVVKVLPAVSADQAGPSSIRVSLESEGIEEIDLETTLTVSGSTTARRLRGATA